MMTFYQFIERLQAAGWAGTYDGQWDGAKKLYDELITPGHVAPLPAVEAEALRDMLPKLVLWGMATEEIIATQRGAFVAGYREGLCDGLLSKDDAEGNRAHKYAEDLRLIAATVAATNGQTRQ